MKILRNDRVILIKGMGKLQRVGEVFEVANITEQNIVLRSVQTKIAVGAVSISDFDEYFKKEGTTKGWTPWQHLVDNKNQIIAFYRTNQKKVQVRTPNGYRAEASCNKCDEFNLFSGIRLAFLRCNEKFLKYCETEFSNALNSVHDDMKTNNENIKQLLSTLNNKSV